MGARVVDDLATVCPGIVPVRRRLHAGFLQGFFVVGPGGFELLRRLLVVGSRLGDQGVAFTQHP